MLNMYMSGHYINLLAGLWRKKWTYCETLIVYICIRGLSFKAHFEKVHGKVFVRKKWVSGSMSRSFEGHNVAYRCSGPDLSNIVCEYEVNWLPNEKVIRGKRNFNANWKMIKLLKNNVFCQEHLKVKVIILHVCEKVLTLATKCVRMM